MARVPLAVLAALLVAGCATSSIPSQAGSGLARPGQAIQGQSPVSQAAAEAAQVSGAAPDEQGSTPAKTSAPALARPASGGSPRIVSADNQPAAGCAASVRGIAIPQCASR